jgi:hypothetical protein
MKTKFTLILLILTAHAGFSQDWNLFVLGRNSYYKQQYDDSAKVENFLLDSVLSTGHTEISYFNSKSTLKPDCYHNIKQEFEDFGWLNPNKIDRLIKVNDSVLFTVRYPDEQDTFIFKPYAKLNDSWSTNGVTISCSALGVLDIFGNQDSVKTYTCAGNGYDGIEFILSKNHGFIKFLPLNEFLYHSTSSDFPPCFELIGFSDGMTSKGYTQPDFSDYFHLHAGDLLYWRDYSDPFDITQPRSTTYHLDSITYAYISPDSVHYDYKRISYNGNGAVSHVGNYSTYHLRKDEGNIVQNHTSWFGLKYNRYQSGDVFFLESLYYKTENHDTVTYAQYYLRGLIIDTISCETGQIMDYDLTVGFSTRAGKIFQGTYSWGESSTTLIGSIIDGVKYGATEIPTGVVNIRDGSLMVYPNPVKDYLTIVSLNHTLNSIEIYDVAGNLVTTQKYRDNLYLGELKSGVYIVKIWNDHKYIGQRKIIKQ